MYNKLNEYSKINIDHTLHAWTDKTIYDQDSGEFIFISMIGFNTTTKDIIKVLNKSKNRVYISLRNAKWAYSSNEKYKTMSKKTSNSNYVHTILYQDDQITINQSREDYKLFIYTTKDETIEDKLFEKLKKYSSVPLLDEWKGFIKRRLALEGAVTELTIYGVKDDMNAHKVVFDRQLLVDIISNGLRTGEINIAGNNNPSVLLPSIHGLNDYLDMFGEFLAKKIQTSFKPKFIPGTDKYDQYVNDIDDFIHDKNKIELFEAQKSMIQAITNNWRINKSTILSGEMGAGKTLIASAATYTHHENRNKGLNCLIMCPSHLQKNWENELTRFIPNVKIFTVHNLDELLDIEGRLRNRNRAENIYVIMSKEVAKLSYDERPCAVWSQRKQAYVCPECGEVLMKEETQTVGRRRTKVTVPLTHTDFASKSIINDRCHSKKKIFNEKTGKAEEIECGCKLWVPVTNNANHNWIKLGKHGWIMIDKIEQVTEELAMRDDLNKKETAYLNKLQEYYELLTTGETVRPTIKKNYKYPVAKYIKKRMPYVFDYFIADELHQLASESHQGQALHYLTQSVKHMIGLTGTILNGYANSIYYILYRLCPSLMKNEGFDYEDEMEFARLYGVYSRETRYQVRNSRDRVSRGTKEKLLPGISTLVFTKFLLNNTAFISLDDMTEGLPSYTEIPLGVEMNSEVREGYRLYEQTIANNAFQQGSLKVMGQMIRGMTNYPDAPHCATEIRNPDTDDLVMVPRVLPKQTREKEEKLMEIIRDRVRSGERVLVYYNAINQTDIGKSLVKLIASEGYYASELTAKTKAEDREDYINKLVNRGVNVLICNPTLVETGLNLLDFTTIVFYQMGYNLSTMRQASRRSWRLSQKHAITVYFMYYEDSVQEQALSLMANKLAAAQSMEGKFSEEGLRAMSNNQSILTQIANNVCNGMKNTVDNTLFKSSNFVKKAANNERPHAKTKEDIEYLLDDRGRRVVLKPRAVKPRIIHDINYNALNNPLQLFI